LSGVPCAGFNGPSRDDAVKDLFGPKPVFFRAPIGAAFFFIVAVGETGDVVFERHVSR